MKRLSLICFLAACAVLADACSDGGTGNTTGTGGARRRQRGQLGNRWRQRRQIGSRRQRGQLGSCRRNAGNSGAGGGSAGNSGTGGGNAGDSGAAGSGGRGAGGVGGKAERRAREARLAPDPPGRAAVAPVALGVGRRRHQSGLRHGEPVLRREGLHFLQLRSARQPGRLYRTSAEVHRQPVRWGRLQPLPAVGAAGLPFGGNCFSTDPMDISCVMPG